MIIVPWATLQPTRSLVASAQPHAPIDDDEAPRIFASLRRRLSRHHG